jgi:hypothetical protein
MCSHFAVGCKGKVGSTRYQNAIGVYQSYLYERGLHKFQAHAKEKLEEAGVKNAEKMDAIGVYQSYLYERGLHKFQLHAKEKLEEAGIENVDPIGVYQSIFISVVFINSSRMQRKSWKKPVLKTSI